MRGLRLAKWLRGEKVARGVKSGKNILSYLKKGSPIKEEAIRLS